MLLGQFAIPPMKRVVFHSSLLGTRLRREDLPHFHDRVLSLLRPGGTLVVPSYTLGKQLRPFDPLATPSVGVGAYSEFVRKLSGSVRSASPLHSHSGIGPEADLLSRATTVSFGPNSDFELFEENDFWLVLFNTSFTKGATVLHHVEAISNVPYRTNILVHRVVTERGKLRHVELQYPARVDPEVKTDFDRIVPLLRNKSSSFLQVTDQQYGVVSLVRIRELIEIGKEVLERNPNFFRVL